MESHPLKTRDQNTSQPRDHGALHTHEAKQEKSDKVKAMTWSKMRRRSKHTLLLCSLGIFFMGCQLYLIVPYYPAEAAKKGAPQWVVGFVLGSLHLVIFICSPIFGNFLPYIGATFLYLAGAFVGGCSTVIFGLVTLCNPGIPFIVCSILCRVMVAVGTSAFVTAGFAILTNEFPNHIATAYAFAEVANGVGFMTAPAIGGVLFEVGGFFLPLIVCGSLVLLNGLFLYLMLLPPTRAPGPRKGSILSMFRSPLFCVGMWNILNCAIAFVFLEPTLGKRLEMFDLSSGLIGLCFLITPAFYAALAPLYGYLSDVKDIPATVMMCGSVAMVFSYLLMGPAPVWNVTTDLWFVVIFLALLGVGIGATCIPPVKLMVAGAIEVGFSDDVDTYGIVSGGLYSAFCAGGALGNAVGGILLDKYGFPIASMIIALTQFVTLVITSVYFAIRKLRKRRKERGEKSEQLNLSLSKHSELKPPKN